jgi:hypothetical protein
MGRTVTLTLSSPGHSHRRNSFLQDAFLQLSESEKYEVTLTGLCNKILDAGAKASRKGGQDEMVEAVEDEVAYSTKSPSSQLDDAVALLQEMNRRNIAPSARSVCTMVDAAAFLSSSEAMEKTMREVKKSKKRAGGYGSMLVPAKVQGTENVVLPRDERGAEVSWTVSYLLILSLCFGRNALGGFDPDYSSFLSDFVIWGSITTLVVDNVYGIAKKASEILPNLPELPSVPDDAIVGKGRTTGKIVKGLTRLLSTDTQRECRTEAACLVVGYNLGLPCFSFRANALEAAALVYEGDEKMGWKGEAGIVRIMVWLWAGVVKEQMKHEMLLASDPRQVEGLLTRLKKLGVEMESEERGQELAKYSYLKARDIVENNAVEIEEIAERLLGGKATVGDCVAYLEGWEGEF